MISRITIIYDHAIAKYKEYDLHLLFPTYGTLVMIVIWSGLIGDHAQINPAL